MPSLSQALRLAYLPSSHSAFQGHATHTARWPAVLRPNGSRGTCIPQGMKTFLHHASRRTPSSDYYALSATPKVIGVSLGSPLPTLHSPYHSLEASRVHREGLDRDDVDGVFLAAPSALCGSPTFTRGTQVYPCTHLPSQDSGILGLTLAGRLRFLDGWLTYQARYVRVTIPRRAMHASFGSSCHLSAKHRLLDTCFLLMVPFRAMLLTS